MSAEGLKIKAGGDVRLRGRAVPVRLRAHPEVSAERGAEKDPGEEAPRLRRNASP